MSITYSTYESTWLNLLTYPWDSTDSTIKIQLLSSSYTYSVEHATLVSVEGAEVGTPVNLVGTIADDGSITCADVGFGSQELTACYAVIYVSPGRTSAVTDPLLFHMNLNSGEPVSFNDRKKISFGAICSWSTA